MFLVHRTMASCRGYPPVVILAPMAATMTGIPAMNVSLSRPRPMPGWLLKSCRPEPSLLKQEIAYALTAPDAGRVAALTEAQG